MVAITAQESCLIPAPAKVLRGWTILASHAQDIIALAGQTKDAANTDHVANTIHVMVVGGQHSLPLAQSILAEAFAALETPVECHWTTYGSDCSEKELERLRQEATETQAQVIVGVGGGKAIDTAKLLAHQLQLAITTVPTCAATCAAWTPLSNVYSNESGAFHYDVPLDRAPDLLILDYDLVRRAPLHTLTAGIGDALAKWYEASISSSDSDDALTIAAVQQARVLRDLLLQKSEAAIANIGGTEWVQVVDACVCLAGVMGGLGGPKCRTVAAHAVHNGLTHLVGHKSQLHGAKVAFGILVQLRLEEILQGRQLAQVSRQQLLKFYATIDLPTSLDDLNMAALTAGSDLQASLATAAAVACAPTSDIHHLPFAVTPAALMVAMSTTQLSVTAPDRSLLPTP